MICLLLKVGKLLAGILCVPLIMMLLVTVSWTGEKVELSSTCPNSWANVYMVPVAETTTAGFEGSCPAQPASVLVPSVLIPPTMKIEMPEPTRPFTRSNRLSCSVLF